MSAVASDWNGGTIDDLVTHETKGVDPSDADGLPYVGLEHIDTGEMSLARSGEPTAVRSRKTLFETGDILYGKLRPYLDKAVLAAGPGICSTDILVLRPKSGIDPYFAGALLHLKPFVAHAVATTSGVNHPRTSWNAIRAFEVAVPPLPEQRAIAHVLHTVQRAKEATEQVITAAQELKKSLMRHLFGYGSKSNTEEVPSSVDTEFGAIPAHWRTSLLSDCAVIQSGATKGRRIGSDEAVEVPYLRVANVQDGFLDLREIKTITIKANELDRFALRPGDILLTEGGDFDKLGRGHIWRGQIDPCVHQNHIFAVRPDSDRALPEFASYLMQSPYAKRYFLKVAHRTTNLASINKAKLGRFPMLLPPIEEQEQIVHSLAIVDQKIAAEEARHDALAMLFDSLLHDLMTAKLRITELIPEVA